MPSLATDHRTGPMIKFCSVLLQGNMHNDYLRYGKRIIHEGYCKYNTSKAIHYA